MTRRARASLAAFAVPVCAVLVLAAALVLPARPARAEYRAYELEVVDIYECRLNKRERCRRANVRTGLAPDIYQRTHGGSQRIGVLLLATWMCYGDTSNYEPVCPRPATRNGKFSPGETVRVKLAKHITDGWRGVIEVAYYQRSVRSNVYGVRFSDRQNVYARYYEKDLVKAAPEEQANAEQAAAGEPQGGAQEQAAPGGAQPPAAASQQPGAAGQQPPAAGQPPGAAGTPAAPAATPPQDQPPQ